MHFTPIRRRATKTICLTLLRLTVEETRLFSSLEIFHQYITNISPLCIATLHMKNLSPLTCTVVSPAIGCDLWEMLALGLLFYSLALVSFYFLVQSIKRASQKLKFFDQTVLFWISIMIFQLYRGTLLIAPIDYDYRLVQILFLGIRNMLLFIPMCLAILILFNLLFTYQNPGTKPIIFFQSLFILFFLTFTALIFILALIDHGDWEEEENSRNDPEQSFTLWVACTDFIILVFFFLPAYSLLKIVKYPIINPDDKACINFCDVGLAVFTVIFVCRIIFNILSYAGVNPLQNMIIDRNRDVSIPVRSVRIANFFGYFIFDLIPSVLVMIAVRLFKSYDVLNENPYYTQYNQ